MVHRIVDGTVAVPLLIKDLLHGTPAAQPKVGSDWKNADVPFGLRTVQVLLVLRRLGFASTWT